MKTQESTNEKLDKVVNQLMDIIRETFNYEMDGDEDFPTKLHELDSERFSVIGDLDDHLYGQIYNLLMGRIAE